MVVDCACLECREEGKVRSFAFKGGKNSINSESLASGMKGPSIVGG